MGEWVLIIAVIYGSITVTPVYFHDEAACQSAAEKFKKEGAWDKKNAVCFPTRTTPGR